MAFVIRQNDGKTVMEKKEITYNRCYANNDKVVDKFTNDQWKGNPCFIIGGGESLKGFDFSLLKDRKTIGVNRAFEVFDADVLYFMDCPFYREIIDGKMDTFTQSNIKDRWKMFPGIKVSLTPMNSSIFEKGVYVIRRLEEKKISRDLHTGMYGGNNSGTGALMLAAILGASPIYLLGFDFKIKESTHWHSGYPHTNKESLSSRFISYRKNLVEVAPLFEKAYIKVVNLNPDSSLRCFEFDTVERVLG